jgi:hypothetical protein
MSILGVILLIVGILVDQLSILVRSASSSSPSGSSSSSWERSTAPSSAGVTTGDRVGGVGRAGVPRNSSATSRPLYDAGSGRVAQWESARFTRERSLVRNQPRPSRRAPAKTSEAPARSSFSAAHVVRKVRSPEQGLCIGPECLGSNSVAACREVGSRKGGWR